MFHAWAEISGSHQAENSTPKSLLRMPDNPKLITQKSQNATRPANPEEAPSKSMPKPTPEHPVGHPNVPTQKATARNSADSQCFRFFRAVFYSNIIYNYKA